MSVTRETQMLHNKRRYVRGGKVTCSKPGCAAPHAPSHRYCRQHKNDATAAWHRRRAADAKAFRNQKEIEKHG